ncbi:AMP-binding protein [Acidiphilium multivorum]|nr:AMP-binding protein [Acidiphilium multivorum]
MTDFITGLEKTEANYQALSPLSFLARTAKVWPERTAIVHGSIRRTWAETFERCKRLGAALAARGIGPGDVVAVMAPNIPAMVEAHFGVAMAGAVLNTLNTRLDAPTIAYILRHGEAKLLLSDTEFAPVIAAALAELSDNAPPVIDIDDPEGPGGARLGAMDLAYPVVTHTH